MGLNLTIKIIICLWYLWQVMKHNILRLQSTVASPSRWRFFKMKLRSRSTVFLSMTGVHLHEWFYRNVTIKNKQKKEILMVFSFSSYAWNRWRLWCCSILGKVKNVAIFPKWYMIYKRYIQSIFLPVLLAFALSVLHKTTYFYFAFI